MSKFIIEFNQALTPTFCLDLMKKFEADQSKQKGRTGSGVDESKKLSLDLTISRSADWQGECNQISFVILRALIQYVRQHPHMITGAISTSIQDPSNKQTSLVTHENVATLSDDQLIPIITRIFKLDDITIQKYNKGEGGYFHWHSEHFPHPTDKDQGSLHRVLLWLVYLNDIDDGGETEFYYQGVKVVPQQGRLIMAPCDFTHTHRGNKPISQDKYVLASWVSYNLAQQMYG